MTEWTITCGELWLAGKSVKLYKEPHVKDKDGKVYVVPRYANVDPIKLSGYLKGLKRT